MVKKADTKQTLDEISKGLERAMYEKDIKVKLNNLSVWVYRLVKYLSD